MGVMVYSLVLDHIIVAVDNLEQAISDYSDLGFMVTTGGKHASGTTENAIIPFSDGTYIELIALTGDAPNDTSDEDLSSFFNNGEGSTGYALYTDDLDADIEDMRKRGVLVSDIQHGSRAMEDGRVIQWRVAHVDNRIFPLFLQDETPRRWRVPEGERITRHDNGVKGLAQVIFIIDDLHTGIARYRAILGVPPQVDHHAAYFLLEDCLLKITVPMDKKMENHLNVRRDAPYEIRLRTRNDEMVGELDSQKTHGLCIKMVK